LKNCLHHFDPLLFLDTSKNLGPLINVCAHRATRATSTTKEKIFTSARMPSWVLGQNDDPCCWAESRCYEGRFPIFGARIGSTFWHFGIF
jgi:hypothetical protein